MPGEKLGIKESKELLLAESDLLGAVRDALLDDGHLNFNEILSLVPESLGVVKEAKDIKQIMLEVHDLSEAESRELAGIGIALGYKLGTVINAINAHRKQ
jgi:hypothetical protein